MGIIMQTENLDKTYQTGKKAISVLTNINLTIQSGAFVAIMGPSGCGKSSLLYLLGGLDEPTSGNVYIEGVDMNQLKDRERSILRRRDIGFVFQFYNLIHNLTVTENILLPITMDGKKVQAYEAALAEILDIVGLTEYQNYTPRELSGGQQQRVAIARALIAEPKLILADEPIGNLDSASGTDIMNLFKKINEEKGVTVVQVTHSEEAAQYSNRIIRMKDGKIESNTDLMVESE